MATSDQWDLLAGTKLALVADKQLLGSLLLLVVVDVDDVKGVDVAGDEAEDSQGDVDEEVCAGARDDVYADGRD